MLSNKSGFEKLATYLLANTEKRKRGNYSSESKHDPESS